MQIIGLSPSSGGYPFENLFVSNGVVLNRLRVPGGHIAMGVGVYVDIMGRTFSGLHPREPHNSAFTCRVRRHQDTPLKGEHRGNVDYFSAMSLREELIGGCL